MALGRNGENAINFISKGATKNMTILRFNAKRDANEGEIIKALKAGGLSVYSLDKPCDLLVGYDKRNYLVEVKAEKGILTPPQIAFIESWKGQHIILRNVDDAVRFVKDVRKPRKFEFI